MHTPVGRANGIGYLETRNALIVPKNQERSSHHAVNGVTEQQKQQQYPELHEAEAEAEEEVVPPTPQVYFSSPNQVQVTGYDTHSARLVWNGSKQTSTEHLNDGDVLEYALHYEVDVQQVNSIEFSTVNEEILHSLTADRNWRTMASALPTYAEIPSLRPGRFYVFRIRCVPVLSAGKADLNLPDPSAPVCIRTIPTPPSAPQPPLMVDRSRNFLKFKWSLPEETGGETINMYTLQMSPPPTGMEEAVNEEGFVDVYSGDQSSFKVQKLRPGVKYTIRVQAENILGKSPFSLCSVYTTKPSVPTKPDTPKVVHTTSDSITLAWQAPHDNGSVISRYVIEQNSGAGFELAYSGQQLRATMTNLKNGMQYQYRLMAENQEGRSLYSDVLSTSTNANVPAAPSPPDCLQAERTSATLVWKTMPPDLTGGAPITAYEVEVVAKSKAGAHNSEYSKWHSVFKGLAQAATIHNLRPGCVYLVRIRATNQTGFGDYSASKEITTAPDVPDAPSPPTSTSQQAKQVQVQWKAPPHDGGEPITSYRLEVQPADSSPSDASTSQATQYEVTSSSPSTSRPNTSISGNAYMNHHSAPTSWLLDNLHPGSAYVVRVQAVNSIGPGPWSEWMEVNTKAAAPLPPGAPVAVASTSHSITLTWDPPDSQGAAITSYTLQKAVVVGESGSGTASPRGELANGHVTPTHSGRGEREERVSSGFQTVYQGSDTRFECSKLEPSQLYQFRVKAHNGVGASGWSAAATASTGAAAPTPPLGPHAEGVEPTAISISWEAPVRDFGSPVTSYTVECSPVAVAPRKAQAATWQKLWTGKEQEVTLRGFKPGRSYLFRVRASNSKGTSAPSGTCQGCTLPVPPDAPARPIAQGKTSNSLKVKWAPPDEEGGAILTHYVLEVCEASTDDWYVAYEGTTCSCKVGQLKPGTKYKLQVAGVNSAGQGRFSEPETATTALLPPDAPTSLQVDASIDPSTANPCIDASWSPGPASPSRADPTSYELSILSQTDSSTSLLDKLDKMGSGSHTVGGVISRSATSKVTHAKVGGLAWGSQVVVRVRAVGSDGAGHGSWSAPAATSVPPRSTSGVGDEDEGHEEVARGATAGKAGPSTKKRSKSRKADVEERRLKPSGPLSTKHTATAKAPPKRTLLSPKMWRSMKQAFWTVLTIAFLVAVVHMYLSESK